MNSFSIIPFRTVLSRLSMYHAKNPMGMVFIFDRIYPTGQFFGKDDK